MKTLAIILLSAVGLAIFTAILENHMTIEASDALYTLAGLTFLVVGSIISIKILNQK